MDVGDKKRSKPPPIVVTNTFRLQYTSPTPVSNIDLTDLGTLELFLTIEMVYIEVVL